MEVYHDLKYAHEISNFKKLLKVKIIVQANKKIAKIENKGTSTFIYIALFRPTRIFLICVDDPSHSVLMILVMEHSTREDAMEEIPES